MVCKTKAPAVRGGALHTNAFGLECDQDLAELSIWLPHGKNKAPQYINALGVFTGSGWEKPEHRGTLGWALAVVEANPGLLTGVGIIIDKTTVVDGHRLIAIDVDEVAGYRKADPSKGIEAITFNPVTDADKVRQLVPLINQIDTVWEASPSCTGVHALAWAPEAWAAKFGNTAKFYPGGCDHAEFYTGEAPTYITVTGKLLGACNRLGRLSEAVQADLAPKLTPVGGRRAASPEIAEGGQVFAWESLGLSADQKHLVDGTGKLNRSAVLYGLSIKAIDSGHPQENILATILHTPALWKYCLDHRDNNPDRALQFARDEIGRAYAKSMTGMRDALGIGRQFPGTAVTGTTALAPPFEQKPAPGSPGGTGFDAPYLSAIWDDNPAIDWMIYGFLENNVIAEIWGPAGSFKTFAALDIATAVASRQDWHKRKVKRSGPVLYICGEGRRGIGRRLKVLCQERGLSRDIPIRISNMPVALARADQAAWLLTEIAKFDIPPVLIIIDTLARNFGGNENSAEDMSAFIDNIDMLRREMMATALIIHHCGHDGSHARGSYALYAGIDAEYQTEPDKANHSMKIINKKMKDAEEGKAFYFNTKVVVLKNETTGEIVRDDEGQPVTSIVLQSGDSERAARQAEFFKEHPALKGTRANKYKERLPKTLEAAFDDSAISDRAVAKACGTEGHAWVKGLRDLMYQEGLVEGDRFKLSSAGQYAARIFCERVDFQLNVHNLPEKPFPPSSNHNLI